MHHTFVPGAEGRSGWGRRARIASPSTHAVMEWGWREGEQRQHTNRGVSKGHSHILCLSTESAQPSPFPFGRQMGLFSK